MSTTETKMKLGLAQMVARRFMIHLEPYVSIMSLAGSTRRECPEVGDIECVCIAKDEFSMGLCFPLGYPGLTINGTRLKKFVYGKDGLVPIHMELYITTMADYGRILAIRTGSSFYSHTVLAMRWNRLGFCGTEDGLRRKSECIHKSNWKIKPEYKANPTLPPVFDTEEHFYEFLSIQWCEPRLRSWVSNQPEYNYKP